MDQGFLGRGAQLAQSLVEDEFDPTICQEMMVDHGILSILPLLTDARWPAPLVPLAANVIQHPVPTPRRFFKLGRAIRHAIHSYPQDLRVLDSVAAILDLRIGRRYPRRRRCVSGLAAGVACLSYGSRGSAAKQLTTRVRG